jgi:3-hydroxyisobutyrate dehydrogenase-like beta-hydroxyacid dehydrogenase
MQHIGFVGASGLMGHGMAKNIRAKGFDLSISVHQRTAPVQDLLAAGTRQVSSYADLAACDAVLICVTGSPQVEAVVAGPGGILSKARAGLIIIDTSTSEPVIRAYSENVFHVGEMGSGHVVKLLNNFVAQAICTATAEAFAVGAKAGVDLDKVVQVISAGGVNSGLFQLMSKTLQGDYGAMKFELNNAAKDLRYYSHLTESMKVPSIIGTSVHQALNTAVALGYGSEMVPSLVKAQAQLNQVTIVKT